MIGPDVAQVLPAARPRTGAGAGAGRPPRDPRRMTETRLSLLRRVLDPSDQQSWNEFVALYEPLLLAYVRKQGLVGQDAHDVVQNVFVALLRSLARFEPARARFRTWLYCIAQNALVDFWRKERTIRKAEKARRQSPPPAPEPDPEWDTLHHRRILQFATEQVRADTAAKTWACFEEHVLKGRPGAEVGPQLGLSANNVYVNASRVLARIRARCATYREDLGDA